MSKFMEVYLAESCDILSIDEAVLEGTFSDIVNTVQNVLKSIWNAVRSIVSKAFKTIIGYIKKLIDAVKKFFNNKKAKGSESEGTKSKTIEVNTQFKKDVEDGNVSHIRDELTTIAHSDRTLSNGEFDAYLDYAKKANVSGLFDPFDGEKFKPKEEWDAKYWSYINASLMDNFCNERINHLKEVGKYVYGKTATTEAYDPDNDDKLYVPFHRLYEMLIPEEKGIDAVISMTSKFIGNQSMYIQKIDISEAVLNMFNGGKDGSIDGQGNIKYITSSELIKRVYNSSDSERGYKLETVSDMMKTIDIDSMKKLNTKFAIKHTVLNGKIESAYNILSDKNHTLNDLVSKKLAMFYNSSDAVKYKTNFNYNMNVVKSMAKAIMEEMTAIMKLFTATSNVVMVAYINRIKQI